MGSLVTNALWVLCYVIAFLLIRTRCSVPKGLLKASAWMLLPIPVAFASLLWSEDPMLTFFRSIALLGTTVIALYLALRYTVREILLYLASALALVAIASLLMAVGLPKYGIDQDEFQGIWVGAFAQKNALGGTMATAFLVFSLLLWWERSNRVWRLGLIALSIILIVKADSMTSLGICCVLPYLIWVSSKTLTSRGRTAARLLYFATPVLIIVGVVAAKFDQLVEVVGRDANLTGRTLLWGLVAQAIWAKPYLGYGYEAFWRGYEGTAGEIWEQIKEFQFYSHNGFMEIMLGLGAAGLTAVVTAFVIFARYSLQNLQKGTSLATIWPWVLLLYLLLSNLLEGNLMKSNTLPWLLYTTTALILAANRLKMSRGQVIGGSTG